MMIATNPDGVAAGSKNRIVRFFFEPAFNYGGRTSPSVAVLVGPRWTPYLRIRIGLMGEPFFERAAMAHEPDTFPNGHPFAWVYRTPAEASADEARWLNAEDLGRFDAGLQAAQAAAKHVEQLQLPGLVECECVA